MIARNDSATWIVYGEVRRGREEIRRVVDDQIAAAEVARITATTGALKEVGTDVAVAFAPFTMAVAQRPEPLRMRRAAPRIVRRSAERLEPFREQHSARIGR